MEAQRNQSSLSVEQIPTGTDLDEYKIYKETAGLGEVIFDDADDATDAAEFSRITGI